MSENKEKLKILFLCTGNSCRSQMTQGWARYLKAELIEPYSAGVYPSGVNLRAIKVMAEAGVDISMHTSKHVDELMGLDFDYVITLCDNARQNCPVFTGQTRLIHRTFEDPTLVMGSEEEIMTAFRKTRDKIRAFIETLPEALEEEGKNT